MIEIENTVTEIKNAFDGLISRLNTEFPQISVRHQTKDPGSSENKQNKCNKQKHPTLRHIIIKLQKIKDKEKLLKEARGRKTSYL